MDNRPEDEKKPSLWKKFNGLDKWTKILIFIVGYGLVGALIFIFFLPPSRTSYKPPSNAYQHSPVVSQPQTTSNMPPATSQKTVPLTSSTPITPQKTTSSSGDSYLYNGTGNVAVALSESAMDKAVDAAIKKDYQKFDSLVLSGELLPIKDGTKIQILSAGMARTKIRIEDGAYSGQIGYVQTEFVKVNK